MATAHFKYLKVNISLHAGIKKPDMTDKDKFCKVYSPLSFKVRPRDDIYLDLGFNIETPETIEPWLNLLPSLKGLELSIENDHWAENKTTNDTIQLHILNKNFHHTFNIKKKQYIGFTFSLGEHCTDKVTTKYNEIYQRFVQLLPVRFLDCINN